MHVHLDFIGVFSSLFSFLFYFVSPFQAYTIIMKRMGHDPRPAVIERRYNDFCFIYECILKSFHPSILGEFLFPKKVLIGNFKAEVISERKLSKFDFFEPITMSRVASQKQKQKIFINYRSNLESRKIIKYPKLTRNFSKFWHQQNFCSFKIDRLTAISFLKFQLEGLPYFLSHTIHDFEINVNFEDFLVMLLESFGTVLFISLYPPYFLLEIKVIIKIESYSCYPRIHETFKGD